MEYKVINLKDSTYQVVVFTHTEHGDSYNTEVKFQGSLSDCEAWIRLTVGGYM